MQDIQQLAFVLVNALDLHVKQAVRADPDACGAFDMGCQSNLVGAFGRHELFLEHGVFFEGVQALELIQVESPARSQRVVEQTRQPRVRLR